MRLRWLIWWLVLMCQMTLPAFAESGEVVKVLPHFLDLKGRPAVAPSLFERDAYQVELRRDAKKRSGLRVDIQWRAKEYQELLLKVELRGMLGNKATANVQELKVKPPRWFSRWAKFYLTGEKYNTFGELSAWRVTLWDGAHLVSEQTSFLW